MTTTGWNDEARAIIEDTIARAPNNTRPVAVTDFDNTCILNDIGELYALYLTEEMLYRFDLEEFWELIDPRDGRDLIRDLTERSLKIAPEDRAASEVYQQYVAELNSVYGRRLAREGKRDCYAWAVTLHVGMTETDMLQFSKAAIERELAMPLETMTLTTSRGEVFDTLRGIRVFHEMKSSIAALQQAGVEVWLVSASNIWTIRAIAPYLGVSPENVIGNDVVVIDGVLSSQLIQPALHKEGKVGVVERDIGVKPMLGFGDSRSDWNMLEFSERAIFIDTGDVAAAADALANSWAVQPQNSLSFVP